MARKWTGEEIVLALRNIGMVPDAGSTGTEDADLIKLVNEALQLVIVPRVVKTRGEYFVRRARTALSSTVRYRLPHRAMYGKLRNLFYIDSSGDRHSIAPVAPEARWQFEIAGGPDPAGYCLEGDYVVLLPEDASTFSGYLEFHYFQRPGELVLSTAYGVISAVNTGTKTVTLAGTPPSTFTTGAKIDIHTPFSGAEVRCMDLTISGVSGSDVTFSEAIDGSVFDSLTPAVGDYVCLAEEAALPAVPREFHPAIARFTAMYVAESIGDEKMVRIHGELAERAMADAIGATESRVEGKPMRVTGRTGMLGY